MLIVFIYFSQAYGKVNIIYSILQMRLREASSLAQGHVVYHQQSWDLNLASCDWEAQLSMTPGRWELL